MNANDCIPRNPDYYAANFAGNVMGQSKKRVYGLMMQAAAYKMGVRQYFQLKSKNEYLANRIKL
jgi:hypothetical protein